VQPPEVQRAVQRPEAVRMACPAAAPRLVRAAAVRPAVPPAEDRRPARPSVAAVRLVPVQWSVEQPLAEPMRALQLAEGWAAQRPAEAVPAQQLGEPAAWAEAAPEALRERAVPRAVAARPKVVRAVWDAAAVPQPVAASVAVGLPPEEQAGPDVVAALPQEVAAGERLPGVARDAAAERLQEVPAVRVSEVPLRVAPDEPEVLPSAAAWAALPSTRLREVRLVPSPWARSAHARERLRTAQP
jgi:hypothetical protein